MSKQSLLIDNISFAKKNERISGELPLESFPRLQELINTDKADNKGLISYELKGKVDSLGQYILQLSLNADLMTSCQRCLNTMPLNLNLHFNYLIGEIGDTEVEVVDLDNSDDYDIQQANKAMDLMVLIEDEIIMAMPIAPMHEEGCSELATQSGAKPNPFAVLKDLIKP